MTIRQFSPILFLAASLFMLSCAHVSKRMPASLDQMHNFLTQDDPGRCRNYHYNFERQAPRLFSEHQRDSILDLIEYIKTECGPTSNLEITRLLLLIEQDKYDDSLIGMLTVPQMLWFRSDEEHLFRWNRWSYLYGSVEMMDNSHHNFKQFRTALAQSAASNTELAPSGQTIGQLYSGNFDSAFNRIQTAELRGTVLQNSYDEYAEMVKSYFPTRGNIAFSLGSWSPKGDNRLLGNHPEIGFQLGGEGKTWRFDWILGYRFLSAKNDYVIDSLGQLVTTDKFNSWLIGVDVGYKIMDKSKFSTDIFAGIGYDAIYSVSLAGDPEESKTHGSFALSGGIRQRVFINQRKGLYIGGTLRYSVVDYGNPRGTDLSGNTLTLSVAVGWSFHTTLKQFLTKMNYQGDWRP